MLLVRQHVIECSNYVGGIKGFNTAFKPLINSRYMQFGPEDEIDDIIVFLAPYFY